MKIITVTVLMLMLSSVAFAADKKEAAKEKLKDSQKLSYALGMDTGVSLKRLETEIDIAFFAQGVEDTFKGSNLLVTPEQATKVKEEFFKKMQEERTREKEKVSGKNQKEGETFLSENKKKKGVITTPSGLQYMVLTEGDGPMPKETDKVKVHYKGTLLDGTEFDSSYKRGEPITFALKGVIPGWTEGLQLMKVGSKCRFFIPSNLAYGERGGGATIGPNAALIFEVELLGIEK